MFSNKDKTNSRIHFELPVCFSGDGSPSDVSSVMVGIHTAEGNFSTVRVVGVPGKIKNHFIKIC